MKFVINELKKLKGQIKIKTSEHGTKVSVYLPSYRPGEFKNENSIFD